MQNPVVPHFGHDDPTPSYLSMISSENRFALFRIMLLAWPDRYSRSRKLEPISAFLLMGS
ncbi:hypothetical protein ABIF62_007015 [Bradyrhizobium japonicum]